MSTRYLKLAGFVVGLSIMIVCFACKPTMLDKNWGKSFEMQKQSQILNPDASENMDPVLGLDGYRAEKNIDTYRKGPAPKKSKEIGVISIRGK
jgi:hypothetical protein